MTGNGEIFSDHELYILNSQSISSSLPYHRHLTTNLFLIAKNFGAFGDDELRAFHDTLNNIMSSRARFYAAFIILSFCLSPTITAVTDQQWIYENYWIDDSCSTRFSAQEAIAQSRRGAERVADPSDINDELIFNILWQKPRSDVDTWQDVSSTSKFNAP